MKKFFSLVLALVMALSLTTVAWGAAELPAAVDGVITLTEDVTLSDTYKVDAGTSVTIDLNGKTLSYTSTVAAASCAIENKGTLTIKDSAGGGKLTYVGVGDSNFGYGTNTITNCGKLTIDGGTIINTTDSGSSNAIDNAPGAELIVNSGVIKSEKVTIRLRDNSTATINGGEISGARAVQIHLFQNVDAETKLTINGGTLTGSELALYSYAYGNCTFDDTTINIAGGTFEGDVAFGGGNKTAQENVTVTGGTFNSGFYTYNDTIDDEITISGGTFSTDVSEYVVDGMQLLANGTVVPTPAASATDPVLYKWDNAGAEWDAYFIATGDDLDDLKMDASDNCLPCYKINGEYFVEVKEAAATYKLVYGAKTVFLAPVDSSDVRYSAKASVLKVVDDEDATCGDWYVTDLDEDDVYYISYDKKGVVVEGVYVAAKNGPVQILVKGKIVDVKSLTQADIKQLPHDWKGYDVVNHEYTTVKCANCGKVATLYANGTAAGKNAVKVSDNGTVLGYITAAADSFGAASAGTSTDKTVTSAETFDAGIAMYVGMSVMAAAGSVVVLKKRED